MRIFFLNSYPDWGGSEQWVIQAGLGLKNRGHQIVVASLPSSPTEKKAREVGLEIFPFNLRIDVAYWKMPKLIQYFKKEKTEVVICIQNRDVKVGALAAKIAGVPVVLFRNGLQTIHKKFFHKIAVTKFIDGIIVNAKSLKEIYMDFGWFSDSFITVNYGGLRLPENVEQIDLKKQLNLSAETNLLVSTGRLVRQKGFDYLIEVAVLAKKENKNWAFIVVGSGKLEQELKSLASERQIDDIFKFVGFKSNVLPYMNAADVFVLSSISEGLSSALREAMSLGKPCVSTDVSGVKELFHDNQAGLIVPIKNPKALFEGIEKVLEIHGLKEQLGHNALERIKEDFLEETMLDRLEDIFQHYLSSKRNQI